MNLILLSGGSGQRLWPLSNETRSKQFLKVLRNDAGEPESMVQRVHRQIRAAGLSGRIVVATGRSQVDPIRSQLGAEVEIVLEPERRDTFPATALACAFLAHEKGIPEDEPVVVLPVDPYAEAAYFETIRAMERLVRDGAADLVLMGIRPTYPSSKYGYILPRRGGDADGAGAGADDAGYLRVARFQEKPSEALAARLIAEEGALWNGGVFAFRLGYLLRIARTHVDFATYAEAHERFAQFPRLSFDYAVAEKEPSIAMRVYEGVWKDLGTWNTLTEVMERPANGDVVLGDGCENTHAINELGIPLVVLGAKDMVVAAGPDGILVSDKARSAHMKPYVARVARRPMVEERRWGGYRVLEVGPCGDGLQSLTKRIDVRAGMGLGYQCHAQRDEVWTVVDGEGEFVLEGAARRIRRGDVLRIGRGEKHAVRAESDLRIIAVQIGACVDEDDVERFEWTW